MKVRAILLLLVVFSSSSQAIAKIASYNNELGKLCWPTQFSYENGYAFISDYKNKRILFSKIGNQFILLNVSLKGAHSIRHIKGHGYLIDDTEGNRVIQIDDLKKPIPKYISIIAGKQLVRPHDILDGRDGYIYIIDDSNLFRIKDLSGEGEVFPLHKDKLGYVRSLSLMDGKVDVISASMGEVIRIEDFNKGKVVLYHSAAHKVDDAAGSFERTGPILNSVIKLGSYYYGSNYFTKSYARGSNYNTQRLIRWRSWKDFEKGKFEDMSSYIPKGLVPYFLSTEDGKLLLTSFDHEEPCKDDKVFSFSLPG